MDFERNKSDQKQGKTMDEKLSPQAVHLLNRVKESIQKEPERYDPRKWRGSAFCVAGWISNLVGKKAQHEYHTAREALGISDNQAFLLFCFWPFECNKHRNPDDKSRAEAGCKYIDDFIGKNT
jgi:hypothetical protein